MKKILTIAASVLLCGTAFSQEGMAEEKTRTFSIGPSVGFGYTGIRNTQGTDQFKPHFTAGVILNYSTSEHVGFAADILYSQEGANFEDNFGRENNLTLHYIRLPLKFAYFFGDFDDNFRPKVTIGPSLGYLVDANTYLEGYGTTDTDQFYQDFDMGGNASIGFNLKLKENIWLNTDFNYYTSFTPVRGDLYNSNYGIRIGVAFGL